MSANNVNEAGCCNRFNPEPWDAKVFEWDNKNFVKDKVFTFFYIPLNFGKVISRLFTNLSEQGLAQMDAICLSDHTSKWNMDIYVSTDKEAEGLNNIKLSGKFISKVYDGSFKDTAIWCDDFKSYAASRNIKMNKIYMWYTTCPKCAKIYGHNYVVIIGQIEQA